jgi:hypothetical protein
VKAVKNSEGATSVLVIFMMIVLVTFGAFAITSAHVNLKFSHSAQDWTKMYYSMDAEAQAFLFDLDACLAEAAYRADDDDSFWDTLDSLMLGEFASKYPGAFVYGDFDDDGDIRNYVDYTVTKEPYNLVVQVAVNGDGSYPRFTVTEWREWQQTSEYAAPEVWQPAISID